ncbi:MAG: tetratricopeptide repeat protein [Planctomycetota bacterium]
MTSADRAADSSPANQTPTASDPASPANSWIIDTNDDNFVRDVIERSQRGLVVLDFWATWCQPCRILGPVLESLAQDFAGQFTLVKAQVERVPSGASQFNVQSIPAVFAVLGGETIDFFTGAQSREQIRGWIERLLIADELRQAREYESTAPHQALAAYQSLLEKLPKEPAVSIGLARTHLALDQIAQAAEVIHQLARRGFLEEEAEKVKAALELRTRKTPSLDTCREAVAAAPHDLAAHIQLGEALAAAAQYEEALAEFLQVATTDRGALREQARVLMVDIFRVLPADSELTRTYRRKLSSALY